MAKIESAFFDLGYLDTLAAQDTAIHRLDPRIKLVTTLVFVVCVVSFDKHEISALLPFFLFPAVLLGLGQLPPGFLAKKLLLVSPFAIMVGIFNPLLDQHVLIHLGPLGISGGWLSFLSILLRFTLTVSAVLILIATTGFNAVCMALEKLGAPKIFAVQLLVLYRYLFVLVEEGLRMNRARALRSFQGRGLGLKAFASFIGQLLLRTLDRAQRIHLAMLCRGFDGEIRIRRPLCIGARDLAFLVGWSSAFILMRAFDLPQLLGILVTEFGL